MPTNEDWDTDPMWHYEPDLDRLEAERRVWTCACCGFRNARADCVYFCQECELPR